MKTRAQNSDLKMAKASSHKAVSSEKAVAKKDILKQQKGKMRRGRKVAASQDVGSKLSLTPLYKPVTLKKRTSSKNNINSLNAQEEVKVTEIRTEDYGKAK
jgi:hypothetical protein